MGLINETEIKKDRMNQILSKGKEFKVVAFKNGEILLEKKPASIEVIGNTLKILGLPRIDITDSEFDFDEFCQKITIKPEGMEYHEILICGN